MVKSIERFFKDKDGHWAIVYWPNVPLWAWILCTIALRFFKTGQPHAGFTFLSGAALSVWAYLEITNGKSTFRRVLGAVVLASMIISHFR